MRTCPSCGGVLGRDCFNPADCAQISASIAGNNSNDLQQLQHRFEKLLQILKRKGIDVSELETAPELPEKVNKQAVYLDDSLPF
ncbi:MAG TPA: hypothetical protein VGK47_08215 [Nitrososphaeraceae archaeon]